MSQYIALAILWCAVLLFSSSYAWGQADSASMYKLQISKDLPFEKVLQEQEPAFFSANRKLDSLKHIAINVSIITKERLKQAGVTNVPEALQLLPEFVLKIKGNGLYNVEYRGAKSTYHSTLEGSGQENLLLLLNAVPFNDALSGEVWWEAVPVSIEDIEMIEVIHSPQGTWYGYGGALGVVNIITKKSTRTAGIQLKANLQAGQFQSHAYHGSLNIGINDHIAVRVGANYQARERFQDAYFINSASRYISSDSLLFFQPEAFQTHLYTDLSLQSSGFFISSTYQWNDSIRLNADIGNQSTQAQSLFLVAEEIPFTTRESQNRWFNVHFSSPAWRVHLFHQSGDKDYAKGYAGLQYQTAKSGARLEYHKVLGRYGFLFGTEGIKDQYSPNTTLLGIPLFEEVTPSVEWSQLLLSLYLQQTATFLKNRLYLESGQRVYQKLQELEYPLGYHLALKWFFASGTSLQLSASQTVQSSQQLFENEWKFNATKIASYELGIQKQLTNKGMLKSTVFNQHQLENIPDRQFQSDMPEWGGTLEGWYQINRWTVRGHATRFFGNGFSDDRQVYTSYPDWIASISGNFSTLFNRVNLNTGIFYYSKHTEERGNTAYHIPVQWAVNIKCSYRIWNQHLLYINVRNLMNQQDVVVPFADQNHRLIMLGMNIVL
ncbi:TonB-dependent receptor plug domain-containing protein [Catalinimonas niigatensis]|uniref:TonB-dependent receptor plug domain-containing protein n=1 Tax=Catalinimonas niigatensis TaxID=1397264 RepID=UPI0026651917|nr:TonB-dependent receptor plug domain-containing protein [Catalinimonas niigatensis]WPP48616.1 TonB-dependent receptor plug domain-containing protein [Catalinimonas niigatensis]